MLCRRFQSRLFLHSIGKCAAGLPAAARAAAPDAMDCRHPGRHGSSVAHLASRTLAVDRLGIGFLIWFLRPVAQNRCAWSAGRLVVGDAFAVSPGIRLFGDDGVAWAKCLLACTDRIKMAGGGSRSDHCTSAIVVSRKRPPNSDV